LRKKNKKKKRGKTRDAQRSSGDSDGQMNTSDDPPSELGMSRNIEISAPEDEASAAAVTDVIDVSPSAQVRREDS